MCSYRLLYSPVYRRRLQELSGDFSQVSNGEVRESQMNVLGSLSPDPTPPPLSMTRLDEQREATRMTVDIQSLRRNTKRFRENPDELGWLQAPDPAVGSPERTNRSTGGPSRDPNGLCFPVLEQVWWRRVVFDEFHELEAPVAEKVQAQHAPELDPGAVYLQFLTSWHLFKVNGFDLLVQGFTVPLQFDCLIFPRFFPEAIGDTAQFDSLQCICAGCRWGLTGTPPTRDLSQVATLAKLFQLPGLPCGDGCDFEVQLAQEMAQSFLDRFARQNTSEEIEPVPLKEHLVAVEQTPEERAIYMQASHDLCEASGGPLEITGESRGIEKLIKLCSHFAAYSSMASGPSADAGTECRRILSSKEQQAKRAANQMLRCCMRLDMRLREASVASSNSSNSSIWQRRFEVHSDILRRLGAKIESPAAAGTEGELPESPATLQDDRGTLAVVAGVSQPSAAAARLCYVVLLLQGGPVCSPWRPPSLGNRAQAAAAAALVEATFNSVFWFHACHRSRN